MGDLIISVSACNASRCLDTTCREATPHGSRCSGFSACSVGPDHPKGRSQGPERPAWTRLTPLADFRPAVFETGTPGGILDPSSVAFVGVSPMAPRANWKGF